MAHETVTLVLITADPCVGVQYFNRKDYGRITTNGMRWIGEPKAETREAIIESPDGEVLSMNGDLWRAVEANRRTMDLVRAALAGRLTEKRLQKFAQAA